MKFKVGDKVRIVGPKLQGTIVSWISAMDKYVGEIRTIVCYNPYGRCYDVQGILYHFDETWLEPVNNQKILITTDGKETKARLYDGKKVVKEAVAKCSPKDEFDFETGAEIAFDRLMGKEEKPQNKPYNAKLVCVKQGSDQFKKGKIYTVKNGFLDGELGIAVKYPSCEQINKYHKSQFIELVED